MQAEFNAFAVKHGEMIINWANPEAAPSPLAVYCFYF